MARYEFGELSTFRLGTLDSQLRHVLELALKSAPYDFTIICGYRNEYDQNKAYSQGMSTVRWPNSKHNSNPSRAVDVAPYPIDWTDERAFCVLAGVILSTAEDLGIALRWGGDWDTDGSTVDQSFMDIGHFELV